MTRKRKGIPPLLTTGLAATCGAMTNTAMTPTPKLEEDFYDWDERHQQVLETIRTRKVEMVFIGDSITHLFGGVPRGNKCWGKAVWNRYYGSRNAVNLGFGWDRTQNVLWRLTHGELDGIQPRAAVLLIGTNNRTGTANARENSPAEIADGIAAICRLIHEKAPACRIILVSVLPRGADAPSPAGLFVESIRDINRRIAGLESLGYVTYLDLWPVFAQPDGTPKKVYMVDTVHLNAIGYQQWAETMEPVLAGILKDTPIHPPTRRTA